MGYLSKILLFRAYPHKDWLVPCLKGAVAFVGLFSVPKYAFHKAQRQQLNTYIPTPNLTQRNCTSSPPFALPTMGKDDTNNVLVHMGTTA